jgi:hypothetical protein
MGRKMGHQQGVDEMREVVVTHVLSERRESAGGAS